MLRGEKNGSFPRPSSYLTPFLSPLLPRFPGPSQPNEISSRTKMRTGSREGDRKMEKGKTKERVRARVGETPFDQLRLINGVGGGVVDGERGRGGEEWKGERKGEESVAAMSEPIGALWVYAIKNVNICRRLVIGCKYGGGARRRDQKGRGGPRSSFVSLFIGMHGRAPHRNPRSPSKRRGDERNDHLLRSSSFSSALVSSRLETGPPARSGRFNLKRGLIAWKRKPDTRLRCVST